MAGFDTLSCMPGEVTSGDSVDVVLPDLSASYPVGDFTLQVIMKLGAAAAITVDLADVDGSHGGTLGFADAVAGTYAYAIKATRVADAAVRTVQNGSLQVLPDPASQDVRTHAEKVLEAIEALIEGRATKDVSSYSIAGRSLTRMSPDELVKWRSHYRNEVAKQRNAGKPNGGRRITLARFR